VKPRHRGRAGASTGLECLCERGKQSATWASGHGPWTGGPALVVLSILTR